MGKVEKFKELLKEYESYLFDEWVNNEKSWSFLMGKRQKYDEIIQIYKEALNEQETKSL